MRQPTKYCGGKCQKTKFCGRNKVLLAVTETVSHFNTASTASLLKAAGVVPSENMMSALPNTDIIRIKEAAIKVSEKACLSRRKLRATKKSEGKAKVDYVAGGYGLSKEPEDSTTVKANNSKVLDYF